MTTHSSFYKWIFCLFFIMGCISRTTDAQCNFNCPPCNYNVPRRPGHGTNGNGQTIVNVAADSTWSGQELTTISSAIVDACAAWNGQATCGSTPYFCNHVTDATTADVLVSSQDSIPTCADTNLRSISGSNRSGADTIELRSLVAGNESSAARFIEHEFGHVMGLTNSGDTSQCNGASSIMTLAAPLSTCISTNFSVTANDVAQVDKAVNSPSQCTRDVYIIPQTPTTSCPSATSCPQEPKSYVPDGIADRCQNGGNGCSSYADVVFGGCCYESDSPILIDVGSSGFHLTDAAEGVMFDFNGTNLKRKISWTSGGKSNAWLVLDINHNGMIDSGRELFGNYSPQSPSDNPNGFLALAEFDKPSNGGNGDGKIDQNDQIFTRLQLWIDENHDGVSEAGELHSLLEYEITAIELKYETNNWQDAYGNLFRFRGRIQRRGRWQDRIIYDVLLLSGT